MGEKQLNVSANSKDLDRSVYPGVLQVRRGNQANSGIISHICP